MSTVRSARPSLRPELRETIEKSLGSADPGGGLRAFAFEGITCVLAWHPRGASGVHEVRLALRSGGTRKEHVAMIADLSHLARTCEHHLREFAREHAQEALPALSSAPSRSRPEPSAEDRMRARLELDKVLAER